MTESIPKDLLSVLPTELTHNILSLLPKSDIRSLLYVSKAHNALAIPHLYHTISISTDPYYTHKLSRALQKNPSLAPLVRHLTFTTTSPTPICYFIQACFEPLRNLQSLTFNGPFTGLASRIARLHREGVTFPMLRSVKLGSYSHGLMELSPIWKLPALEELQVVLGPYGGDYTHLGEASELRTLNLRASNVEYELVSEMLVRAPKLRRLNFSDYREVSEETPAPDCTNLHLEKLANLESVYLDVIKLSPNSSRSSSPSPSPIPLSSDMDVDMDTPTSGSRTPPPAHHNHLPPINNLTRLQTLSVPFSSLLGSYPDESPSLPDMIPPSLSQLWLNEDYDQDGISETESTWTAEETVFRLTELLREMARGVTAVKTVNFGPVREGWGGEAVEG